MLEAPEGMRRVLLCMLDDAKGELCLLDMLDVLGVVEVMRCVLLCIVEVLSRSSEALDGGLCLLGVLDVLEVLESMRCALLCMLEAVEGKLCMLEVPEVMSCVLLLCTSMLEVPDVMRHVLLCMLKAMRHVLLCMLEVMRHVFLCMLKLCFEISIVVAFSLRSIRHHPASQGAKADFLSNLQPPRARRKRKHLLNSTPSPPSIQPKPSFQDSTNDYAPGSSSLVLPVPKAPGAFHGFSNLIHRPQYPKHRCRPPQPGPIFRVEPFTSLKSSHRSLHQLVGRHGA